MLPNNIVSETFLQKSGAVQVLTGDLPLGHWPAVVGQIRSTVQNILQSLQYTADPGVQMKSGEQSLPSTTAVAVFLTIERLPLDISAHTLLLRE